MRKEKIKGSHIREEWPLRKPVIGKLSSEDLKCISCLPSDLLTGLYKYKFSGAADTAVLCKALNVFYSHFEEWGYCLSQGNETWLSIQMSTGKLMYWLGQNYNFHPIFQKNR